MRGGYSGGYSPLDIHFGVGGYSKLLPEGGR